MRIYGFKKMHDPIVYTLDGKLIGGIEGFKKLAEEKFSIETHQIKFTITPEVSY
jgi:hypothetical protein